MTMSSVYSDQDNMAPQYLTKRQSIEVGAVAGLLAGFAIFLIIFAIDAQLAVIPGTFYKMVGIPIGLEGVFATVFGLIGHMLTAGLIGATFYFCSTLHKKLEIRTPKKGALAGGVTGMAVYAIFFIPITVFVMTPALDASLTNEQGLITSLANIDSQKLVQSIDVILLGALEMHIVFGIIMGTVCGITSKRITSENKKKHSFKTIVVGIIAVTVAIASYYVIVESYSVNTIPQTALSSELDRLEEGLTYSKFVELDMERRTGLVSTMSGNTINMILQEAKKHNSTVSEDMQDIISNIPPNEELKFIQIGQIQGLKGNAATGQAYVILAGDKSFLRFEKFSVTNGPALHVVLTKGGDIATGYDVGRLKANQGEQNYEISGIDTTQYNVVIIYSEPFGIYYASSELKLTKL